MTKVNESRWGEALWNQRPRIDAYTQDNIAFTDQVRTLAGQLAQVEQKYAKDLRHVLRQHEKTLSDQNTTVAQAWRQIFVSLDALASAHENAAGSFVGPVSAALADLTKETTKSRKDILSECAQKDAGLSKEMEMLGKERAKFSKLEKDEDQASQAFLKAESSDTVTKAKVEKARKTWEAKSRIREEAQKKLQIVLDQVNSKRTQFFHIEMPESIDKMQAMDENRSSRVVAQIGEIGAGYNSIGNAAVGAATAIKAAVGNHSPSDDSKVFALLHKTTDYLPDELTVKEQSAADAAQAAAPAAVAVPQTLGVEAHAADEDEELPEMSPAAQYPQARILYEYTAEDGSIACGANEVLGVIQNDGSGWILVMKQDGTQGYVPSTYMEE